MGVLGSVGNVIVLTPFVTLKVRVTGVAGAKVALPACEAVIEQEVPAETKVIVEPEMVHTPVWSRRS